MKLSRAIWISIGVLLLWLLLSWLLGSWLGIHPPGLYYLRGGLSILGIIGFIGYLLLHPKGAEGNRPGVSTGEVDDNFNEAANRLQTAGVKQMAALPAVFFLGDSDTAKTSVIAKSDLAQLLAGQAQQEVSIVPTRAVNFWLAKNTVFIDPAGALVGDVDNRKRLFKKFSSVALRSVMGSRQMPTRSVVFTVSCETLLQKGGADAMAVKARQFQAVLAELAQEIGSRFPVYVLFTKADKLSYFRDFVENLSELEASDVFGVTLPLETQHGVYAQQQTSRLNDAFQQLYYWLADHRPSYLIREHKPAALPNIYEFPREFNKLRPLITSFLVDLCRPSQLGISPFLRGFYFTGIRPVTVSDVTPAALQVGADDSSGMDSGATRMFMPQRGMSPIVAETRDSGARKIAQWVYLNQLLPAVILADGPAATLGSGNVKLNVARRLMLGAAAAFALLMGIWWTISYSNNRALVNGVLDAAKGAPSEASLDGLNRLTQVKNALATLNYFQENGTPFTYGGFLYSGDDIRESVSKTYYGMFRKMLLAPTQENLRQVCTAAGDSQPQDYLYDDLKAYLMTTQYHAKSVPEFLTPTLLLHWKAGHSVGPEEERLARVNFDFYSRELLKGNKYWPQTAYDTLSVGRCREYLNGLGQTVPIYRRVLADAGASGKSIMLNRDYPGTEATVINTYEVPAAFTKAGFERFQELLKDPKKYLNMEPWVLEPKSPEMLDLAKLSSELQRLYKDEFIEKWQTYLKATKVLRFGSVADATAKLDKLTSSQSALLRALCVASENTAVPNAEITTVFQPAQFVTPPGCTQALVGGGGAQYMTKLVSELEALKALDHDKPPTYDTENQTAIDIDSTVKNIALNFKGPSGDVVARLLEVPIYTVTAPTDPGANQAAEGACREINKTLNKYPFNPSSSEDASMGEVDKFLRAPDGFLWAKLVNDPAIAPLINQVGDTFTAKAQGKTKPRDQFLKFLTRAATLSHALYGPDGKAAGFRFTISPVPSPEVVEHVELKINGDIQSTDVRGTPTKEFQWPGNGAGIEELKVRFIGGTESNFAKPPGLWGVWHFLDNTKQIKPNEYELIAMDGKFPITTNKGLPEALQLIIDPAKAPMLRPHFFNITCVSKVN